MKAKKYFEACGRRDCSRGLSKRLVVARSGILLDIKYLPLWAIDAYTFGWVYQQNR